MLLLDLLWVCDTALESHGKLPWHFCLCLPYGFQLSSPGQDPKTLLRREKEEWSWGGSWSLQDVLPISKYIYRQKNTSKHTQPIIIPIPQMSINRSAELRLLVENSYTFAHTCTHSHTCMQMHATQTYCTGICKLMRSQGVQHQTSRG